MTIRNSGKWMTVLDDRILEYLEVNDWSTPRLMAKFGHPGTTKSQVEERCIALARADYIAPAIADQDSQRATMWELTTRGRQYLDGTLNAEMYRPLPAPRPPEAVRPGWYAGFESVRG